MTLDGSLPTLLVFKPVDESSSNKDIVINLCAPAFHHTSSNPCQLAAGAFRLMKFITDRMDGVIANKAMVDEAVVFYQKMQNGGGGAGAGGGGAAAAAAHPNPGHG
jgi:hypothetical protein